MVGRRWAAWPGLLLLAALTAASAFHAAWADDFDRGLLWEVRAPDGARGHVFGTIHSEDPRVIDLPGPVRAAFADAEALVMEMVPDPGALASVGSARLLAGDRSLEAMIEPGLYQRVVELVGRRGIPPVLVERLKPWVVAVTLSMPQPQTGRFLDRVLYERAQRREMPVHGLETASEQLAVFDDLSTEDQVALLRATVEHHDEIEPMLDALHDAYLERDLAAMQSIQARYMDAADRRLVRLVTGRLIDSRNARMVERAVPYLERSGAFVAVGALHLPGEEGLLQRLADRGYDVERVY